MKKEVDDTDKDVQFLALFLKQYSTLKYQLYGEKLDYTLDACIDFANSHDTNTMTHQENSEDKQQKSIVTHTTYNVSSDSAGLNMNLANFFLHKLAQNNPEKKEEDEESSDTGTFDETVTDYEYNQTELEEKIENDVNKKMAIASIDVNRSILTRGVEIGHNIMENIIFKDGDEIVDEYKRRLRTTSNSSEEMSDTEFNRIYSPIIGEFDNETHLQENNLACVIAEPAESVELVEPVNSEKSAYASFVEVMPSTIQPTTLCNTQKFCTINIDNEPNHLLNEQNLLQQCSNNQNLKTTWDFEESQWKIKTHDCVGNTNIFDQMEDVNNLYNETQQAFLKKIKSLKN